MNKKAVGSAIVAAALGLWLVAAGLYWFSRMVPGFDTQANHRELKDHRDRYKAIAASILKQPLPGEGTAYFLLSPIGATTVVSPCPAGSISSSNPGDLISVEIRPGRTLIWITTFPGGHFGQYYLVYCSAKPVMNEDFNLNHKFQPLDDHWWAVEDHSG